MVILGFMLNYALRVNLTIGKSEKSEVRRKLQLMNESFKTSFFLHTAIVAMVRHDTTGTNENVTIGGNETGYSTTINPLAVPQSEEDAKDRFEWSAYEQNIILGI